MNIWIVIMVTGTANHAFGSIVSAMYKEYYVGNLV